MINVKKQINTLTHTLTRREKYENKNVMGFSC